MAEAQAGRPLFAGFGQPLTEAAAQLDTGVANTHVLPHAGRLLALEEAHLPTRLDPATLATLGTEDFGGALSGRFTAHPKRDPATGQLVFFSYSATGPLTPGMSWGTIEADGRVSRLEIFEAPYCSMVHDFGVSARHVVFPVLPLTGSMERRMAGAPPFAWEPERGGFLGVLRRDAGAASLVWQEVEARFVFHVMNTWDDGEAVVMDVVEYDHAPLFPRADGRPMEPPAARLCRWRIDPAGRRPLQRETLHDAPASSPAWTNAAPACPTATASAWARAIAGGTRSGAPTCKPAAPNPSRCRTGRSRPRRCSRRLRRLRQRARAGC